MTKASVMSIFAALLDRPVVQIGDMSLTLGSGSLAVTCDEPQDAAAP